VKVTVSIPDALHHAAERFARERDMPLDELYATALREYLAQHRTAGITARLDAVY
jgi:metal-responsive CopG/Arc/MetJ family transcriptional regulator